MEMAADGEEGLRLATHGNYDLMTRDVERWRNTVEMYRRWQGTYGDILVQMNVEDTRFGVAEYVVEKLSICPLHVSSL